MFGEVVLKELSKICKKKFKLKIVLKFRNNYMCSIEMWMGSFMATQIKMNAMHVF